MSQIIQAHSSYLLMQADCINQNQKFTITLVLNVEFIASAVLSVVRILQRVFIQPSALLLHTFSDSFMPFKYLSLLKMNSM